MSTDIVWQCNCHCWDKKDHEGRLRYLAQQELETQPKWFVSVHDLMSGKVVKYENLSSEEAWSEFDRLRYRTNCNPQCRGGYHFCEDVVVGFDGSGYKSSIWS